jgi:hypothetical protein
MQVPVSVFGQSFENSYEYWWKKEYERLFRLSVKLCQMAYTTDEAVSNQANDQFNKVMEQLEAHEALRPWGDG